MTLAANIHDTRSPLLTAAGDQMIRRLCQHPDAPRFNYATGDRLWPNDLPRIDTFRAALRQRSRRSPSPSSVILERVERWRVTVPWIRQHIPANIQLDSNWNALPTTSRADIAMAAWSFVPDDESLERLVIYRTAGTTGHPITVPHHPLAVRFYEPMLEFALSRHGATVEFDDQSVACFLVGAQIRTYTYATVLYNWNGAGFAKLNIRSTEWPSHGSQQRYFNEFSPRFLSGDPISFSEMMRMGIDASPAALVTTSVALSPGLRKRLSERYKAPVIDWYSMVETGPIGYACPIGFGYHLLPHDLFAEVVNPDGTPTVAGQRGEITITGGRNPLLPLFRYRTGDFGILDHSACPCGDPMPRFLELEGRAPVLIRSADGTPVSTVDLSRLLREFPLLLHEFTQHADLACELIVRPLSDVSLDIAPIATALGNILGNLPINIRVDNTLGDRQEGKAMPYRSELMLED